MTGTFVICNNAEEIESNMSCWGNQIFEISEKDIIALLEGMTLAATVNGEYSVFITKEVKK